jgi:hypothetical protein
MVFDLLFISTFCRSFGHHQWGFMPENSNELSSANRHAALASVGIPVASYEKKFVRRPRITRGHLRALAIAEPRRCFIPTDLALQTAGDRPRRGPGRKVEPGKRPNGIITPGAAS